VEKIRNHADDMARYEEVQLEDVEVVIVAFGITARVARRAVQMARERGVRAGLWRPLVVWPFPETRLRKLVSQSGVKGFVVAELNLGQVVLEVERVVGHRVPTVLVPHAGGTVHHPEEILEPVLRLAKKKN
jgi:2-oxoglutarate ferredoxin oxidoreductase subunit alpha